MDLAGLPKTELHLHLEGAVLHEILLDLIHKYGDGKIVPNLETLKSKLKYPRRRRRSLRTALFSVP